MSEKGQGANPHPFSADWGIILGSGLGDCGSSWPHLQSRSFEDVGLQIPTVPGHQGRLEWRSGPNDRVVLFCKGRLHAYEGHALSAVCQTIEFFAKCGIRRCLITCAAGGIHKQLAPGDLVLAREFVFVNHQDSWKDLARRMEAGATIGSIGSDPSFSRFAEGSTNAPRLWRGLHAQMIGPSYETPGEVEMLARLGVWTVGMSSGVELARARELGLLTGAIAVVANLACGLGSKAIEHEDVLETMAKASGNLERVIHHLVLETSSFQFDQ